MQDIDLTYDCVHSMNWARIPPVELRDYSVQLARICVFTSCSCIFCQVSVISLHSQASCWPLCTASSILTRLLSCLLRFHCLFSPEDQIATVLWFLYFGKIRASHHRMMSWVNAPESQFLFLKLCGCFFRVQSLYASCLWRPMRPIWLFFFIFFLF